MVAENQKDGSHKSTVDVRNNLLTDRVSLKSPFDKKVLNIGFLFGLLLSACCLGLSGYYLYIFLQKNSSTVTEILHVSQNIQSQDLNYAISANLIVAGFALSSCGICLAMSFGFLGFCLFLIGVGGEMEVSGERPDGAKLNLSRMAPGVFVILCATLLATVCVTRRPTLKMDTDIFSGSGTGDPQKSSGKEPPSPSPSSPTP